MKYLLLAITICAFIVSVASAQESTTATLLLSEVQLGTLDSASEEYVEIVNISPKPIDLSGIQLQYKSKDGANWSTKAELDGYIAPYGRYLISNYLNDRSMEFSGGLSGSAGHLRIASDDVQIDLLGWGEAAAPDTSAVEPHGEMQSLKRVVDEDGVFLDTDDNSEDWFVSDKPSPSFDKWLIQPIVDPARETDGDQADGVDKNTSTSGVPPAITASPGVADSTKHKLRITEVMPDPKAPLKDSEHEFVELFNPNAYTVNLLGYVLESGIDGKYKSTLGAYELKSGEYIGLLSSETKLTLSNAGTTVRLMSADGTEIDAVEYPKAKAGQSWSRSADGESWGWTDATINAPNLPIVMLTDTMTNAGNVTQPDAITKKDIEFPSTDGQADALSGGTSMVATEDEEQSNLNNWVLAGVGGLTVLYSVYEYRKDIRIRIQQLGRYISLRRENWKSAHGRGNN